MGTQISASHKKHRSHIQWERMRKREIVSVHITIALVFRQMYPNCRIFITYRSQMSDENDANENLHSL